VELNCSSAPIDPEWYRLIGSAIPLRRYNRPGGISIRNPSIRCRIGLECSSTRELVISFRVRPEPTATGPANGNSPGVWSLSALSAVEARYSRVYLTRHLPASGFHTLLPAYFFRSLPALFHAGNALRVFLQGLSPPQSLRSLSEPVTFVMLAL